MGQDTTCKVCVGYTCTLVFENIPLIRKLIEISNIDITVYHGECDDEYVDVGELVFNITKKDFASEDEFETEIELIDSQTKYFTGFNISMYGIQLVFHIEIIGCDVRNISRRTNPAVQYFTGVKPSTLIDRITSAQSELMSCGIEEADINISYTIRDSC